MTVRNDGHGIAVQAARPYSSQTIAIGAGSVACNAFQAGGQGRYTSSGAPFTAPNSTTHIRVVATSDCWISFGTAPVAVAASSSAILLPAGIPEYFWVVPGERLACIQVTGAGSLNIAELVN